MFTLLKQEERRGYLKTKQVIDQIKKKKTIKIKVIHSLADVK